MSLNIYTPLPSTIFFVDPVYLKQVTALNDNVDDKLIMEAIQTAQDMYILPILGSTYMEEMLQQISGNTVNQLNQYVINSFIRPCLAAATMIHLLPFTWIQFKNKGPVKQHSDYSSEVGLSEVSFIMEKYREKAAFYAQRLTNWLLDNNQLIPEWLNPQLNNSSSGADLFYPQKSAYNCNIFLNNLTSGSPAKEYQGWGLSMEQLMEFKGLR